MSKYNHNSSLATEISSKEILVLPFAHENSSSLIICLYISWDNLWYIASYLNKYFRNFHSILYSLSFVWKVEIYVAYDTLINRCIQLLDISPCSYHGQSYEIWLNYIIDFTLFSSAHFYSHKLFCLSCICRKENNVPAAGSLCLFVL